MIEWLSLCPNFATMLDRLKNLFREPLVHFTIFGLLLFLMYDWFGKKDTEITLDRIEVPAVRVEMMISRWEMQLGRPPTDQEVQSLIRGYIREEVLSREAKALGLDQEDLVIRRRLAQKMELLSIDMASVDEPDSADLFQYFTEHKFNYQAPGEVTFYQVYISTETRTPLEAEEYAEALLEELLSGGVEGIQAGTFGDPFILPGFFPNYSIQDIRGIFGSGAFVEAIFEADLRQWTGPVQTSYGLHLIYVTDREDIEIVPFEHVRDQVYQDYMESRRKELGEAYLTDLINRYHIVVEEPYSDILKEGQSMMVPE